MWIRSQDRYTLINVTNIEIVKIENGLNTIYKLVGSSLSTKTILGEFINEEKALSVMDSMQTRINNLRHIRIDRNSNYTIREVYNVPVDEAEIVIND